MYYSKIVVRGWYWRSVFQEHADSGLSIRRFCQENGISQSTFYAWRKKLSKEPSLASSDRALTSKRSRGGKSHAKPPAGVNDVSPASGQDDQRAPNPGTSFVAVKLPAASEPIEVVHPLGYVVRVASGANLDCLTRIFQILDQHAAK
jgi:hypothetical protein